MLNKKANDDLKMYERKTQEFLDRYNGWNENDKNSCRGFSEDQKSAILKSLNPVTDLKIKYARGCLISTLAKMCYPIIDD